ncbi:MAG: multicopper oxidase domain-containing protein [Burkholderiaceae bacterium]
MSTRRKFVQTTLAGIGVYMLPAALLPKFAVATTQGNANPASWSGATDPELLQRVWDIRFSNTLPWALDPTNTVLAKALNVDSSGNIPVLGGTLNASLPQVGFIYRPDAGSTNTFSVKAGQVPWPMLGPLGGKFNDGRPIPVTTLWGYGNHDLENAFVGSSLPGLPVTFPGRTFVVQNGQPITVNWYNNLVDSAGNNLPHLVGVDQTISMQVDPQNNAVNGVPIAVHHHGGDNAQEFDGGPDQWFTPVRHQIGPGINGNNKGAGSDHLTYRYENTDEASMHWYHDHGEGVTRINAYAGLAGLYVIRDANEAALIKANLLPTGEQEVPIVIQDKVFQKDGNLAYTGDSPAFNGWANGAAVQLPGNWTPPGYDPNLEDTIVTGDQPTHVPEMFGDVICVNGVAWPNLQVEPRQYRLRLLNGSDSRVYNLNFGGLKFFQVGTDLGLLNFPWPLNQITIFPGERKDIVIDFASLAKGAKLVVTNNARFPYPNGDATLPSDPWATIMQIEVSKPLNEKINKKTHLGQLTLLRGRGKGTPLIPLVALAPPNLTVRQIMLGEGCDEYGRVMPLLGTVAEGTKTFHDPADIQVPLGSTEVWEFWNSTVDAHPIHMHLVKFRVLNRQTFAGAVEQKPHNGWYGVKFTAPPQLTGGLKGFKPAPFNEQGWKDTVECPPGQVTRVLVTFNRPGKYVYHCHILGHEEHDMMGWFKVV